MQVSIVDLRRRMPEVLRALSHNEVVTILYRGKPRGKIYPVNEPKIKRRPVWEQPAFGMWKDRKDMKDVEQFVRRLRKARTNVV